jgi:hypothetical protein
MAKTKRRTDNIFPIATVESKPMAARESAGVSEADIARRAFAIFCERGGQHGRDLDDWLQAKRELLRELRTAVA